MVLEEVDTSSVKENKKKNYMYLQIDNFPFWVKRKGLPQPYIFCSVLHLSIVTLVECGGICL